MGKGINELPVDFNTIVKMFVNSARITAESDNLSSAYSISRFDIKP